MRYQRKEVIGDATLYLGDCREIQSEPDIVFTSPPYAQQRDYGQKITDWDELMSGCFQRIRDTGQTQIFVNLGQIHRDGEVIPYWETWREWMRSAGWRFLGGTSGIRGTDCLGTGTGDLLRRMSTFFILIPLLCSRTNGFLPRDGQQAVQV